jgi:hypothetical protein
MNLGDATLRRVSGLGFAFRMVTFFDLKPETRNYFLDGVAHRIQLVNSIAWLGQSS